MTNTVDDNNDEASFQYTGVPEEEARLLSRLFFMWERPLFVRANQLHKRGKALEQDDLLPLPTGDHGENIGAMFEKAWEKQVKLGNVSASGKNNNTKQQDSQNNSKRTENNKDETKENATRLRRVVMEVMGPRFIVAGVIKALNTALQFCFPLLLNAILKFIEKSQAGLVDETDPWYERYRGYWLSAVLLVLMASKAVTENAYFHRVWRAAYQAKTAISVAVYNKSLRLSNAERQSTTLGEFSILFSKFPHTFLALFRTTNVFFNFQLQGNS